MNDILAVVDWIEHMLISSFFNPSQPCRAGLRIHNECCPASSLLRPTQLTLYVELLGAFLCVGAPPQLALLGETNFISFSVLAPISSG